MSKATKLRFALITEDVLDKLRPRSQSESVRSGYMNEIYTTIRTAVNEAVDEKLQEMSASLNQMVDEKVERILERRQQGARVQRRNAAGVGGQYQAPGSQRRKDVKDKDESTRERKDLKDPGKDCKEPRPKTPMAVALESAQRRRQKKPGQDVLTTSEGELAKKPVRTMRHQRITVQPIHSTARETQQDKALNVPSKTSNTTKLSSSGSAPPPSLAPLAIAQTQILSSVDHNSLEDDFSDVEEPSILTIAARYLKQLEESRRRKLLNQQQHHASS
ncbi:hypothetical protein KR074_002424 [Drosophila pseudoananassae]|nr:hypothetical protein KR074_002424 [Drosophila pseudoananassae]